MQPLKILAFVIGAVPIAAFLLTLLLTEGAPLKPLSPREESGPAGAKPVLPPAKLEPQDGVWAGRPPRADIGNVEHWRAVETFAPTLGNEPAPMVNAKRDAKLFMMLFGVPQTGPPPAR